MAAAAPMVIAFDSGIDGANLVHYSNYAASLTDASPTAVIDLETGELRAYDTGSRWVREGWTEVAEERRETRERAFRRAKLESVELVAGEDFFTPLRNHFVRREARRGR